MRPLLLSLLTVPLLVTTAAARPSGGGSGGGGGGGALSKVSSGIGSASRGGSPATASSGGNARPQSTERIAEVCYDGTGRVVDEHDIDECYYPRVNHFGNTVLVRRRARIEPPSAPAKLSFYAGAQKVADSDGSASIELGVTDWRLRVGGTFTRYFERQPIGGMLTMSLPTLTGGFRIDDMGETAVYLEGGVAHARTNGDVMGDSKLTGPIAGLRVEHTLSKDLSLLGDVQQMWFPHEIRATAGRVGVRYKYVQASFRALDFNVGPPLYGPEVGVRF